MPKKIKLTFTRQELATFNEIWNVEMDWYQDEDFDRMVELVVKEVAVKFLKKGIGASLQKNSITLKEYEGIALKVWLDLWLDWREDNEPEDIYLENLVKQQYRILDQKTK